MHILHRSLEPSSRVPDASAMYVPADSNTIDGLDPSRVPTGPESPWTSHTASDRTNPESRMQLVPTVAGIGPPLPRANSSASAVPISYPKEGSDEMRFPSESYHPENPSPSAVSVRTVPGISDPSPRAMMPRSPRTVIDTCSTTAISDCPAKTIVKCTESPSAWILYAMLSSSQIHTLSASPSEEVVV